MKETAAIHIGVEHHQAGHLAQAEAVYNRILHEDPDNADALHLLGLAAFQRGEHDRAVDLIKKAINQNNSISVFHYNLGNVFKSRNKLQDAADCFNAALRLNSKHLDALNNLGNVLREQGKIKEALLKFHALSELDPDFEIAHSNQLLTLNYHSNIEPGRLYHEHLRWAQRHADPLKVGIKPHANDNSTDRRLRIGYVSPDLRRHSVAYFIEPVLEAHDRSTFEIICYADVSRPDSITERLRGLSDRWRNIWQLSDNRVADLICEDEIDILVDLAGHMANNRLLLFARKPAPLQITYLGYPNTTGLSTMDFRLTDAWADPNGKTDPYYSEKLIRLPYGFLCFKPPEEGKEVAGLPALEKDVVTFGSFNNVAKVSPETAAVWSAILKSVPKSRLILKSRALTDVATRRRIKQMFIQRGVSTDRIETMSYMPSLEDHLALYNEIDIALDPFPYNGTTTTCEALWMGVPVITLAGEKHASRVGVSLLSCIGMTDLIADTPESYKALAIRLSGNLKRLQKMKGKLRNRMLDSNLTNNQGFTRSLEQAYRQMWKHWCQNSFSVKPDITAQIASTLDVSVHKQDPATGEENISHLRSRSSRSYRRAPDAVTDASTDKGFRGIIDQIYRKRLKMERLSFRDFMFMLADTILDQSFFQSRYWNWRYGGVRYYPCDSYSSSNPKKILVMQWPAAIGDAAMAIHFYAGLRNKYPGAEIYLFGNHITQSIYQQSGLIDIFLDNPLDVFLDLAIAGEGIDVKCLMEKITQVVKNLASEEFDLLFNLQILPMTAVMAKLSCTKQTFGMTLSDDGMPIIFGNIWYPYLFGISANLLRSYNRMHRSSLFKRMVGAQDNMGANPASFITQQSIARVQQFFDDSGIEDNDILIGMSPMASFPTKTWNGYDRLIQKLWNRYGAKMILFGSPAESDAISKIMEKAHVPLIQGTHFNLNELMAAISGCDLFIANDTGPMHLACLLRKKVVALFGPTIVGEVGPWDTDYIALQSNQCKACFQSTCDVKPSCMDHISIDDVMKAVDYFLNNEKRVEENVSSYVRWYSSEDGDRFSTDFDEIVSLKYLRFLGRHEFSAIDKRLKATEIDTVSSFCEEFISKIKKTLRILENGKETNRLAEAERNLLKNCYFLKNIVVFNDMKFLDKRRSIREDIDSYRLYYNGIVKDIEHFIGS